MQPVWTFDSTSLPESHSAYTVPVCWSTVIPPGIVLQMEGSAAFVSLAMMRGSENVFPPSFDTVTYTRSSGLNVWYSRYTVSWSGFDAVAVVFCLGYTSIHGRSEAPGWLSARMFCVVQCCPPSRLR